MKRTKRLMATMILAAVATMSTPQAFAGIMIDDVAQPTGCECTVEGHGLLDRMGIMMGDVAFYLGLGGIGLLD
jgi:hypothetical protein